MSTVFAQDHFKRDFLGLLLTLCDVPSLKVLHEERRKSLKAAIADDTNRLLAICSLLRRPLTHLLAFGVAFPLALNEVLLSLIFVFALTIVFARPSVSFHTPPIPSVVWCRVV